LNLAKNTIGNLGLFNLISGLKANSNLVSLDLGSNDIMQEGQA